MKSKRFDIYLVILIIIAGIARFWHLSDWSFGNDELSAITRLNYKTIKDLVYYGVMTNDMHPVGVQLFMYYWTKLFPITEFWLRLPFAIAGIIAVVYFYLILKKLVSEKAAFIGGLMIALLNFTIIYSQLARPYSFGLLFVMMFTYYWHAFFIEDNKKIKTLVLFGLSAFLAAVTHNYSFLVVLIIGISGLFFMTKSKIIPLILTVTASAILYLPNLTVFTYQMTIGGIGEWLGAPSYHWIIEFLHFAFNQSIFIVLLAIILFAFAIYACFKYPFSKSKLPLLFLVWFIVSFLIGFYYSRMRNPILQYSTLVFTFPFLIAFLAYGIDILKEKQQKIGMGIVGLLCVYSFIWEPTTYKESTFGDFKGMAKAIININTKYGNDSTERIIQVNQPNYIQYYLNREHSKITFSQYINHGEEERLKELKKIVQLSSKPYFLNAYFYYPPTAIKDIILSEFPFFEMKESTLGYQVYVYSKRLTKNGNSAIFELKNDFETADFWGAPKSLDTKKPISGKNSYLINKDIQYGPTIKRPYAELKNAKSFMFRADFLAVDELTDISVDYSVSRHDSTIMWQSRPFRYFDKKGHKSNFVFNAEFPDDIKATDIVGIYISNGKGETMRIDNIQIQFFGTK